MAHQQSRKGKFAFLDKNNQESADGGRPTRSKRRGGKRHSRRN